MLSFSSFSMIFLLLHLFLYFSLAARLSYDEQCDLIVAFAQEAASLQNGGRSEDALLAVGKSWKAFSEAIRVAPEEPQAYLSMANVLFNIHEFEESLKLWDFATQKVEKMEAKKQKKKALAYIHERRRMTEFGRLSSLRDSVYKRGQGDIPQAIILTSLQLQFFPSSPQLLFDLGIMLAMRSSVNASDSIQALLSLNKAVDASFSLFKNQRHFDYSGPPTLVLAPQILEFWEISDAFVSGPDALIVTKSGQMLVSSGHPFLNINENWPLADATKGQLSFPRLPNRLMRISSGKVYSIVGYSSTSFYHFLLEGVPRLIALVDRFGKGELLQASLLVPDSGATRKFLTFFLPLLGLQNVHFKKYPRKLEDFQSNVPQLQIDGGAILIVPVWDGGIHQGHCLTPAFLLKRTRGLLVPPFSNASLTQIVWAGRRGKSRKLLEEEAIISNLRKVCQEFNLKFIIFDSQKSVAETVALLSRKTIFLGVHGGALANILFLNGGVIELGFDSSFAAHYQHAAKAFGLLYRRVDLEKDERGMAADVVSVDVENTMRNVKEMMSQLIASSHEEL